MAALTSSDFTQSALNGGTQTWTGTQIVFTRPNTNTVNWGYFTTPKNSNIIIAQSDLTWQTNSAQEDIGFFQIANSTTVSHGYSGAGSYGASIGSRESSGGQYRLRGGTTTSNMYDIDSNVNKGQSVKTTYDTSTNDIKHWYWNGSSWTQMGTTQTYNIKNGGSIYLLLGYDYINTSIGNLTFDNIYFDSYASDYSTHYPTTTSIKTVLGLAQASVKTWNGLAIASVKNINGLA